MKYSLRLNVFVNMTDNTGLSLKKGQLTLEVVSWELYYKFSLRYFSHKNISLLCFIS